MPTAWQRVQLGTLLTRTQEWVQLSPEQTYQQVTVRMWGKGATLRGEVTGASMAGEKRLLVRSGQLILSRIDARHGALAIVPPTLDEAVVTNDFPAFTINRDWLDH